jgi:hypothetical protein
MLKTSYSKIVFPIQKKDPESVFSLYISEFGESSLNNLIGIKTVFANALRDYLTMNISEWELGSLCFVFCTNKKILELLERDEVLKGYVFDCVDIAWLAKNKKIKEYKRILFAYLETLKPCLNNPH